MDLESFEKLDKARTWELGLRLSDGTYFPKGYWIIEDAGQDMSIIGAIETDSRNGDWVVACSTMVPKLIALAKAAEIYVNTQQYPNGYSNLVNAVKELDKNERAGRK
jgi:hypothetical protein